MEEAARPSKKARGAAGSGLTALALRLAKHLSEGVDANSSGGQNLVFSPVSIYAALSLVAAGARGTTLDELLALLGVTSRDELAEFARAVAESALANRSGSDAPLVAFACGLWHEKAFALKPAYRAAAVESYKAETHAVDFQNKPEKATKRINSWVSKATKDLITSILPPDAVHSDTALVVANAIYFKGKWSMPFDKKDTQTRQFHLLDSSTVHASFMRHRKDQAVAVHKGFKVLKLAYLPYRLPHWHDEYNGVRQRRQGSDDKAPRFSMCIFLPDARDGLPGLVDKMASRPNFLWDHLPKDRSETDEVRLPKFKLSFTSRINGVLEAMGMQAAFNSSKADLKDMLERDDLQLVVEHVYHKAIIEVDEEGTEAAASIFLQVTLDCHRRSQNFVADHPFAFFVVEEFSSTVVFMGHVLDPTRPE